MTAGYFAFTVEMSMGAQTRRWWSGSGTLTLGGADYEGTFVRHADGSESAAIAIVPGVNRTGVVGKRHQFRIAVTDESVRAVMGLDLGPISVKFQWIHQMPDETWQIIDTFDGFLSGPPTLTTDGIYSAEIDTEHGRVGSGEIKNWSDTQQQADYPGDPAIQDQGPDLCFENVDTIARGEANIRW